MHDCPDCGAACDCDGEDHMQDAPWDCTHECEHDEDDKEWDDDDWEGI